MLVTYVPEAERLGRAALRERARRARSRRTPARRAARAGGAGRAARADGQPGRALRGRGARSSCSPRGRGRVARPAAAQRAREPRRAGRRATCTCIPRSWRRASSTEPLRRLPRHPAELLRRRVHRPRARPALRLRADADRGLPGADRARSCPGFGREHFRCDAALRAHGGLLALLHDRSAGSVRRAARSARPRIRYALDERRPRAARRRAASTACEVLLAGGRARGARALRAATRSCFRAGDDLAPIARRGVAQAGPNAIPLASTHPQSTCAHGRRPADVAS